MKKNLNDKLNEQNEKLSHFDQPKILGPFIMPINDIDETKPINPIQTLISGLLGKLVHNPQMHIKKIIIRKGRQ